MHPSVEPTVLLGGLVCDRLRLIELSDVGHHRYRLAALAVYSVHEGAQSRLAARGHDHFCPPSCEPKGRLAPYAARSTHHRYDLLLYRLKLHLLLPLTGFDCSQFACFRPSAEPDLAASSYLADEAILLVVLAARISVVPTSTCGSQ